MRQRVSGQVSSDSAVFKGGNNAVFGGADCIADGGAESAWPAGNYGRYC